MKSLVYLVLLAVFSYRGTGQVISEPDDVTICEGEGAVFTCVLNSNIRSDDVQWYRFIKDMNTTVMVDPNKENIDVVTNTIENEVNKSSTNNNGTVNNGSSVPMNNGSTASSSLTITNTMKSDTGYFWVKTSSLNVCNASLTVMGTRPSRVVVNVIKSTTNSSIVVQWDAVDDFLPTTYTVIWRNETDFQEVATVDEQTSYTITGLTLDTVYTITVSAANRCGDGPEVSTRVSLSTDTTSTTSTISPTVTASTNPMTTTVTVNPSSTSNLSTTTMTTNTITTVNENADNSASRNFDTTSTTPIISPTVTANTNPMNTTITNSSITVTTNIANTPTTNEISDSSSSVAIIAGAAIAGIIIVITIVIIIFIIICYFGRRKNGKKHNYSDLSSDGTLNKSTPNSLDANHELGKPESSQQPEIFYMISGIGNKKPPPQKKIETQDQQIMEYAVVDNSKKKEQEHQNGEADAQLQQPMEYAVVDNSKKKNKKEDKQQSGKTDAQHQPMEYAVVDKSKKKNRNKDKQHNADEEPSDLPTVSTNDSANQNRNNPLLHYAELETLPAPTDTFLTEDSSRTPYALVS